MAVNNRTEATTEVNTKIVPTVTNVTHRDLLNNDIINSIVFRKDIIASETPAGGSVTIDYVDKDTATVVITANLAVSFTNIENGDVKYLHITKQATNTISFAGATDASQRQDYIDTSVTSVIYSVSNKNGIISVNSINIPNPGAETIKAVVNIGDWDMNTDTNVTVSHGISDWTKIISAQVIIYADTDNALYPLAQDLLVTYDPDIPGSAAVTGGYAINATQIVLTRLTSGWYDQAGWDNTSYNRGYILFEYLP